jgi:hypothetical protein
MDKTPNEQYELVKFAIERIISHLGELFTRIEKLEAANAPPQPQDETDGTADRTAIAPNP